ncbi:MAG: hypothetical protein E7410_06145 [Ruminococcaceae bacterium]|nr:hypothetical protein [Oscillospiraceae bacterium]
MEKTTKNLFIASAVLYTLSIAFGIVAVTFFWEFVCGDYFVGKELIKPILPINQFLCIISIAAAIIFSTLKTDSKSITPEVLAIIILCGVVPVLSEVIVNVQADYVSRRIGGTGLSALFLTLKPFNYTNVVDVIAFALTNIALGMRIAQKTLLKNKEKEI